MSEQTKDYARGYAAGQRRADNREREAERAHTIALARYHLAAAIAPEIIRSPWSKPDGMKANTADGMAGIIVDMIRAIERRM